VLAVLEIGGALTFGPGGRKTGLGRLDGDGMAHAMGFARRDARSIGGNRPARLEAWRCAACSRRLVWKRCDWAGAVYCRVLPGPAVTAAQTMSELSFDRSQPDRLCLRLGGSWRIGARLPDLDTLRAEIHSDPPAASLTFEDAGIRDWDSSLLAFLRRVLTVCGDLGVKADRSGLPAGVVRLLELADAVPERETGGDGRRVGFLERVGLVAVDARDGGLEMLSFLGDAVLALPRLFAGRAKFPVGDFLAVIQECGPKALPIVSMVSLLVGLILAFMGAIQLRQFGAQIYVADLVAIGMARDMGAIMVGIIMAGRTGAAFAAQLGTMTVNEEIDALRTMGISPIEYLVLPRMLALMLMMPLLTLYGDVLGIVGGGLVGIGPLGVGVKQYLQETIAALTLTHFAAGLFKGTVYGVIVALAGCLRGMQCGRSAAAVGDATTSAVVTSIVMIILSCGLITVVYDVLGI
jgi:phospholipid/cholesterol/gamma-HCH transport system permease protein